MISNRGTTSRFVGYVQQTRLDPDVLVVVLNVEVLDQLSKTK